MVFLARDGFRYRARWSCSIARINYTRPERRLYRIAVDEAGRTSEKEVEITGGDVRSADIRISTMRGSTALSVWITDSLPVR